MTALTALTIKLRTLADIGGYPEATECAAAIQDLIDERISAAKPAALQPRKQPIPTDGNEPWVPCPKRASFITYTPESPLVERLHIPVTVCQHDPFASDSTIVVYSSTRIKCSTCGQSA